MLQEAVANDQENTANVQRCALPPMELT